MRKLLVIGLLMLTGCATTPDEAATERFETCMDRTLATFGPFRFGGPEARLKAAEICKEVMQTQPTPPTN